MKYNIRVDKNNYEVDVVNIDTRPIIAYVNGERFEVWPIESENNINNLPHSINKQENQQGARPIKNDTISTVQTLKDANLYAPIPGIILSIMVKPEDHVMPGKEILIIEAMKMKNIIRATHDGIVSNIHVMPGQFVQHRDLLIEFEDIS